MITIQHYKQPSVTQPVPIMLEFKREDLENAQPYRSITGCLVGTTLRRMGHTEFGVGGCFVRIGGVIYKSDEIGCGSLCSKVPFLNINGYKKSLIGKQVVLYPANGRS